MRNGEAPHGEPAPQASTQHSTLSTPHSYSALRSRQSEDLCPQCHGVGWLRRDVPVHDPRFGEPFPCICRAHAKEQRNLEELYHLSNLDAFQHKIFANFDPELPGIYEAYQAALDFATDPEGWLVLLGGFGTGKTHLAAAIANHVVQDLHSQVYFAVAPDLLHHLRATFAPNSETTYDQRFEQIRSVGLLIIDDLGAEQSTPWAAEKLYQIFNHRYNNRFPTVVTSNCDLDGLDPRIRSRLCDRDLCRHVFIEADDYRMHNADARFISRARELRAGGQFQGRRTQQNPRGTNGSQGR